MRVSSLGNARPAYYDRNATSSYQSYSATVGPHVDTTRWTVTIASGKKLLVEQALVQIYRATAASTASSVGSVIFYVGQVFISAVAQANTIGLQDRLNLMGGVTLYAGETMYGQTYDASTGGTNVLTAAFKGTQYDA